MSANLDLVRSIYADCRTAWVRGGVRGATVHRLPRRPCPYLLRSMPCVHALARRAARPFPSCASALPPVALPRRTLRSVLTPYPAGRNVHQPRDAGLFCAASLAHGASPGGGAKPSAGGAAPWG